MNIVIGSAHRSNAHVHRRYFQQLESLRRASDVDNIRVIAAEGDSTDDTRESLMRYSRRFAFDLELVDTTHGGPHYGSVESPDRMAQLSAVGNSIFAAVNRLDDVLVYVESDLIWDGYTILQLVRTAFHGIDGYDVIAPLIMAGDLFYDVYAYRDLAGNRFSPHYPYHRQLWDHDTMEVGSAGSCLVMHSAVARNSRIRDNNALVGWCADARTNGYCIGVTRQYTVRHPA